jgi:hypothetical protein
MYRVFLPEKRAEIGYQTAVDPAIRGQARNLHSESPRKAKFPAMALRISAEILVTQQRKTNRRIAGWTV